MWQQLWTRVVTQNKLNLNLICDYNSSWCVLWDTVVSCRQDTVHVSVSHFTVLYYLFLPTYRYIIKHWCLGNCVRNCRLSKFDSCIHDDVLASAEIYTQTHCPAECKLAKTNSLSKLNDILFLPAIHPICDGQTKGTEWQERLLQW